MDRLTTKIIFTGQTGIRKKEAIENLALYVLGKEAPQLFKNRAPDRLDLENSKIRKIVATFEVEEEIKNRMGSVPTFLDSSDEKSQKNAWKDSFQKIQNEIVSLKPKYAFVSMHATFFRRNRFFSLLDWDLIKDFNPDIFVTFIEEVFLIWRRVVRRESEEAPTASYFRLRDIVSWRSVEILVTDLLSKFLSQETKESSLTNYVVAVKHPAKMFYRLLFEPDISKVYASFPISKTRNDPTKREMIDAFRMALHDKYTVFDPLAIDEKVMEILLDKYFPKDKRAGLRSLSSSDELIFQRSDRWPLPVGFSLIEDDKEDYPITLNAMEVQEVVQDVDQNIESRDFRLIDQSRCLCAWRPYYEQYPHQGVAAEINYARHIAKISRHLYFPKEDGDPQTSPFAATGVFHSDLTKLYEALDKM